MAEIKTSINQFEIETEDSPIGAVIDFLDENLIDFSVYFIKRKSESDQIDENFISQQLEIFLQRRISEELFRIKGQWEYSDDSKRKPDFGFWLFEDRNQSGFTNAFFELEAKVLPTGSRDYVKGNYGGIERFKKGHHGKGLSQSAMVGYVQKETCSHWHGKINEWITELIQQNTAIDIIWNEDDLLKHLSDFGKVQKYVSGSKREKDSIILHHYLMELN